MVEMMVWEKRSHLEVVVEVEVVGKKSHMEVVVGEKIHLEEVVEEKRLPTGRNECCVPPLSVQQPGGRVRDVNQCTYMHPH